jgi:SAM-dependent methyltransferase
MMPPAGSHDEYATIADLYDYVAPYRDRGDIAFFVDAAVTAGGQVLEVGCGTGRVLIPTARTGIDIVGLDLSGQMLATCRERLLREPAAVQEKATLVHADMRHFDLGRRFALATIPFRPFQHLLTVDDQLSCLGAIRQHLVDGGVLIFDIFNPSLDALANQPIGQETDAGEPEFTMPDGRRVTRSFKIVATDRFSQINDIELLYNVTYPDGHQATLVHAFRMRYLFRYEAEHLLARAGFVVDRLYGGYDRSEYGATYPGDLVFVARKAGT